MIWSHDRAASRDEHLLRPAEALELGGYAPRTHVVVGGEQLRAWIVLLAPLATASRRGVGARWCTERERNWCRQVNAGIARWLKPNDSRG